MMVISKSMAEAPRAKEAELQRLVAMALDETGLLWFHPANERKCTAITGRLLKLAGVKRGVPDCLIMEPFMAQGQKFIGMAVELKASRNKLTDDQKKWKFKLEARGWQFSVCMTLAEVLEKLMQFYPDTAGYSTAEDCYRVTKRRC